MVSTSCNMANTYIHVQFPLVMTDSDLADIEGTGQAVSQSSPSPPLSSSIHLFKLARINSEMKYVTQSVSPDTPSYAYPPIRSIHEWQRGVAHSLEQWISEIPHQENDDHGWILQVCKCRFHEVMVLVLRPSPGIPSPSDQLHDSCFHHAINLLSEFGILYRSGKLFYSRLIVHSILLGTLVILHCIWKVPSTAANCQVEKLATELNTSQNILSSIGEYWHEANRARDCVQELSNLKLQRLLKTPATVGLTEYPITGRSQSNFVEIQTTPQVTSGSSNTRIERTKGLPENDFRDIQDPNNNANLNHRQGEEGTNTSEFTNLFDDFLQGDFQGSDTMFNIDSLVWDFFH